MIKKGLGGALRRQQFNGTVRRNSEEEEDEETAK
jgi:hypothetical protein